MTTDPSPLDHTATSHGQQPTSYSQYDPYDSQQPHAGQTYNTGYSNQTSPPMPNTGYASNSAYYSPQTNQSGPERSYSLGGAGYSGDGYGMSSVPPLPEHDASYFPPQAPAPINTNTGYVPPSQTSPVKGPRAQPQLSVRNDEESPPGYDAGTSNIQGAWGKR